MAYTDPVIYVIGQYFDIYDINPSAGYVTQPFNDPYAHVFLKDGTELLVDSDGFIVGFG